ncbi:MAG: hypothetical protein ED555_03145 [Allomuricauda sp.]|nr:MAG: hypothetical protein ED555_03145 [Allomuricauda sp.]
MRNIFFLTVALVGFAIQAQQLSGTELLEKTITYHDPDGNWKNFKGQFQISMKTPNSSERVSQVHINIPREHFMLEVAKDNDRYSYILEKDSCQRSLNGKTSLSSEEIEKFRLSCERGTMFKNYYTYLYGLPMKLKDPGTKIDPVTQKKTFKGKEYLVLKVTYEKNVGDDTWYFYFDPATYAMEVYQFYHDESKNDGEYILLSGLETINGINMPKERAWYYNKDDAYLGTDLLEKATGAKD